MAERQSGNQLSDIRADHVARYQFAKQRLIEQKELLNTLLDAGAGVGYGSYILADICKSIDAIDNSKEAKQSFYKSFHKPNINFQQCDIQDAELAPQYDAIVCFEFLEHIAFPSKLIKQFANVTDYLICSTPIMN